MQLVDVLGDERMELAPALERDERPVSRVRLRLPRRVVEAALPCEPAHFRIGHVVADVGELFRLRVTRPYALRAAEVRDAGVSRDSGAGQHDDALRGIDPAANVLDQRLHAGLRARSLRASSALPAF